MNTSLARPNTFSKETITTDIDFLESRTGYASLRGQMLTFTSGTRKLSFSSTSNGTERWFRLGQDYKAGLYFGEIVGYTPYITCVKTRQDNSGSHVQVLRWVPPTSLPDLVYHRLDVFSSPSKVDLCRYTFANILLWLPRHFFFHLTYIFLLSNLSLGLYRPCSYIQSFITFKSDKTKLIANPGLAQQCNRMLEPWRSLFPPHWRSQFSHSVLNKPICRPSIHCDRYSPLLMVWWLNIRRLFDLLFSIHYVTFGIKRPLNFREK